MRRLLLISGAFLLVVAAMVSAQTTGLTSLQSKASYGVFTNELDGALSAYQSTSGPSFNDLKSNYIFGGIANLNNVLNTSATTYGAGAPIWLGYFSSGSLPWSLFLGLSQFNTAAGTSGSSTSTTTTLGAPVVVGTTTYNWVGSSATTTQTIPLFNQLNESGQFLTTVSGINAGLYANLNLNDNSVPGSNQTVATTSYYNSAAAGVAPVSTANQTVTNTTTALNTNNTYNFQIPAFMKVGNIGNAVLLSGSFNSVDKSSSNSSTTSAPPANPATAAGSFTNTNGLNTTYKTGTNSFGLQYYATLPFLNNANSKNQAFAGIIAGVTTYSASYGTSNSSQIYNYTGAGSQATTKGTLTSTTGTYALTTPTDYSIGAAVGQRLYFDLGSAAEFGLVPTLSLGYSTNHNVAGTAYPYLLSSITTVNGTSATGDATFATAGDTKITSTNTYTGASFNPATGLAVPEVSQNSFTTAVVLPFSLKFQPKGWVFGITLGDQPVLTYTNTSTVTTASTFTTTTTNAVAGGATTSTTTNGQVVSATGSTTNAHSWSVSESHAIGGQIDLSSNAKVSILFTGTSATGIWDFNNMTVQGIIALK